jgi:hydroxyacylglutathione hydrolase
MNTFIREKPMTDSLIVETLEVGTYLTNCYLVHHDELALIIDPGDDHGRIINRIKKRKVNVKSIILTHGHIDHIGALPEIKEFTGAPVLIHPEDAEMLTDAKANLSFYHQDEFATDAADGFIDEGDTIDLGRFRFQVLHTPGHTPGGISLLTDGMVFTGDALFQESIGRTDFPNGNYDTLIQAIKTKLLALPDDTVVYPGHGPMTTIGRERSSNPWLI